MYISEECISYPKGLTIFGTFCVPKKPFIVNCENSCVLCEKCRESGSRSQVKIEGEGVKIRVAEGFSFNS